jgi:hypothetical protein
MANRTHRGHRSGDSLELRKARQFCFSNSKYDPKVQERIFLKTPEETACFVKIAVTDAFEEEIPDCPQGLVLADNPLSPLWMQLLVH